MIARYNIINQTGGITMAIHLQKNIRKALPGKKVRQKLLVGGLTAGASLYYKLFYRRVKHLSRTRTWRDCRPEYMATKKRSRRL